MGLFSWFKKRRNGKKVEEIEEDEMSEEENEEVKRVKKDVHTAFSILADKFGIKVSSEDYPQVTVKKDETSAYNPEKRTINIIPSSVCDGTAYFEEASHALRDLVQRRKGIPYQRQDIQVQEFFGRAGETLGRYLTKRTELEGLFQNQAPRDLTNPETRKRWAKRLRQYRKVEHVTKEAERQLELGKEYLKKVVSKNYEAFSNLLSAYENGDITLGELSRNLGKLKESVKSDIFDEKKRPEAVFSESDVGAIRHYLWRYKMLEKYIDAAKKTKNEAEKKLVFQKMLDFFKEEKKPRFSGALEVQDKDISAQLGIYSHEVHREPYSFAQQYSAEELVGVRDLYSESDRKIRRRFFQKKSGLETAVATIFYILSPIFIIYLLMNFKFTGFTISRNLTNLIVGSFLGVAFFIFLISFLYFKLKSKQRTLF